MASGKQILISILSEHSQKFTAESDLHDVSDRVKAALLLHCSSAPETLRKVEKMTWLSDSSSDFEDHDGSVWRQGLGIGAHEIFLSDFIDEIFNDESVLKSIAKRFPMMSERDSLDALDIVKWLLTSIEYFAGLSSVESDGSLDSGDREKLVNGYRTMLKHYRNDSNYLY